VLPTPVLPAVKGSAVLVADVVVAVFTVIPVAVVVPTVAVLFVPEPLNDLTAVEDGVVVLELEDVDALRRIGFFQLNCALNTEAMHWPTASSDLLQAVSIVVHAASGSDGSRDAGKQVLCSCRDCCSCGRSSILPESTGATWAPVDGARTVPAAVLVDDVVGPTGVVAAQPDSEAFPSPVTDFGMTADAVETPVLCSGSDPSWKTPSRIELSTLKIGRLKSGRRGAGEVNV
jgi:hypothetical protein